MNKDRLGMVQKQKYRMDLLHMKNEYRPITIHARGKCRCHARDYTWPTGMCTFFLKQFKSYKNRQSNFQLKVKTMQFRMVC